MRHLVVGTNAEGEKEVWWADRAIAWEVANPEHTIQSDEFPLSNAKLVALTDRQAQRRRWTYFDGSGA